MGKDNRSRYAKCYFKLGAAAVVSVLMVSSPVVAESEYLNFNVPNTYTYSRLSQYAQCTEGESLSAAETDGAQADIADSSQPSIKELSQKTTNPTSEIARLFTQFAVTLNDGNHNRGEEKAAGVTVFQPVIPIPVYGTGNNEWRIVSRPTIRFSVAQPIPEREINDFSRKTGLSDLLIPLPLSPPRRVTGNWLLALGPDFSIPTATHKAFGRQQWTAGVAGVLGYKAENWIAGMYPQFYWGFADQGRDDDVKVARFGNMFYWWWHNLSDSLQVGFSPTIQYDDQAESGNRWNVPVGLGLAKMLKVGNTMMRIEVAAEYSVVNQDDFGERTRFKINVVPIVPRPIKKPLFGGG